MKQKLLDKFGLTDKTNARSAEHDEIIVKVPHRVCTRYGFKLCKDVKCCIDPRVRPPVCVDQEGYERRTH